MLWRNSRSPLPRGRSILIHLDRLIDCYASYFGALTCIAWSPDGRFILVSQNDDTLATLTEPSKTGGQDDLLTIFSPWEQRVVARCQGHSSFVSAVAFDDLRCDGRTYRFGSVGEDNKLILVCVNLTFIRSPLIFPIAVGFFKRSAPSPEGPGNYGRHLAFGSS